MKRKLLPNDYCFQSDKKTSKLAHAAATDYIYILGTSDGGLVKIGTTNDLWGRLRQLRGMSPLKLDLLMFWKCKSGKSVEAALHAVFRDYRKHGEWFYFGDYYSNHSLWKYRHLAITAVMTSCELPIPVHNTIISDIQIQHIDEDDPRWENDNLSGEECYESGLFAGFYPSEDGSLRTVNWQDSTRRLYGLAVDSLPTTDQITLP